MEEDRTVLGNAPNVKALVERNALCVTAQASSDALIMIVYSLLEVLLRECRLFGR